MTLRLCICAFITVLSLGCSNSSTSERTAKTITDSTHVVYDDKKLLDSMMQYMAKPSQLYTVSATDTQHIHTPGGMEIVIVPADLVTATGQPATGDIKVLLAELFTKEELVRNKAQTVSNGMLLVSAGAFNIQISSGDQPLQLKAGKTLAITIPKTDKDMTIFYGQRDDGIMNWQPAGNEAAKIVMSKDAFVAVSETVRSVTASSDAAWEGGQRNIKASDMRSANSLNELLGVDEQRDTTYQIETKQALKTEVLARAAISVSRLGWINIDKFYKQGITNIALLRNSKDSVQYVQTFVVFKDINSVMQHNFYGSAGSAILSVPTNKQATLIALGMKNGKVYSHHSDVTFKPDKTYEITMQPASEKDVAKLFEL